MNYDPEKKSQKFYIYTKTLLILSYKEQEIFF